MSTICKIAVTADCEQVTAALEEFLRNRAQAFDVSETEWPAACEREAFNSGDEFPSILSVKQVTPAVTEVHFNSFCNVEELASFLSNALGARAVVNIYQSVSTASYWAFHSGGRRIRSVEAGDGEVRGQSGDRLPFEHDQPGRPHGDDGEQYMVFDYEEQDWYNREVGVPVEVYQEYDESWKNFQLAVQVNETGSQGGPEKPWWKFW